MRCEAGRYKTSTPTYRQIPNTQEVHKIISIRISPEHLDIFLLSLSKEYGNQTGAD